MSFSLRDEADEEVVVPGYDFAFEAHGVFGWGSSHEVMGDMFDGGKTGGRVAGADAAFVVAEDHIHDPVQAVLDCPMLAPNAGE